MNKKKQAIVPRKGLLFRLFHLFFIVILIPGFIFLIIEVFLRVGGYGYRTSFLNEVELDGGKFYFENKNYTLMFFPKFMVRAPVPFIVPQTKMDNEVRIVVLGASAALGDPDPAMGFSRILNLFLKERFSNRIIRVINTSIVAINSHVVREIAKDVVRLNPDIFIVYLGNNEVIGPYGPGTFVDSLSLNHFFIDSSIILRKTKIGQFSQQLNYQFFSKNLKYKHWAGMEMFSKNRLRSDDERLKHVYLNFERNLKEICHIAKSNDIACILSTVGSNLKDCAPFASAHGTLLDKNKESAWNSAYRQGLAALKERRFNDAITNLKQAAIIDDGHADLNFQLGKSYLNLGDLAKARNHFECARDQDVLRFRADTRINEIIRKVGSSSPGENIYFVDAEKIFNNQAQTIPGEELFYEHVHLNFLGNYILAASVLKRVEEILSVSGTKPINNDILLDERECARRLGLTAWKQKYVIEHGVIKRMEYFPFSNQSDHKTVMEKWRRRLFTWEQQKNIVELSKLHYINAIANSSDDWVLHAELVKMLTENHLDIQLTLNHCNKALELIQTHSDLYVTKGVILNEMGRKEPARRAYERALEYNPYSSSAHLNLGLMLEETAESKLAEKHLLQSLEVDPVNVEDSCYHLAKIHTKRREFKKAINWLRTAREAAPRSLRVLRALGGLLESVGQRDEASDIFKELEFIEEGGLHAGR